MKSKELYIRSLCLAFFALACLPGSAQSFFIKVLGDPAQETFARHINNQGEVAGIFNPVGQHYFTGGWIWLPQGAHTLPAGDNYVPAPVASNTVDGEVLEFTDINDRGQVLSRYLTGSPDVDENRLEVWENGVLSELFRGDYVTNIGDTYIANITGNVINNNGLVGGTVSACMRTNKNAQCSPFTEAFFGRADSGVYQLMDGTSPAVSALNTQGRMVGSYFPTGSTNIQGAVWEAGTFHDFRTAGGNGVTYLPQCINDLGEIAGVGISNSPVFIYTPMALPGLASGVNIITTSTLPKSVVAINKRGSVIYDVSGAYFLWSGGSALNFTNFYSTNTGWTFLGPVDMNDEGRITGNGTYQGQTRPFLMGPVLKASIITSTNRVRLGDQFTVSVTCTSLLSADLPNTFPLIPLRMDGVGGAQFVGSTNPVPSTPQTLVSLSNLSFTYTLKATNTGPILFTSQLRGSNTANGRITSLRVTSDPIIVGDVGDLLVKAGFEPDTAYGDDNRYYDVPANGQVRKVFMKPGETNSFNLRVQNDSNTNRSYNLTILEKTNAGWSVNFLKNGSNDVTSLIRSGNYWTAILPTNAFETFTIQLLTANSNTITNAWSGRFVLLATNNPFALDTADLSGEIVNDIIVNTTGDQDDADPNDGVIDVDLAKPGNQVTLRAAINFANKRPGRDVIRFQVPSDDKQVFDGVAQLIPESPLPPITDPVILDAQSQSPEAGHPAVQISGVSFLHPQANIPGGMLNYPGTVSGLTVTAGNCEIDGLSILSFPFCGIELDGASNYVHGCYFGVTADGALSEFNGRPEYLNSSHQTVRGVFDSSGTLLSTEVQDTTDLLPKGCGLLVRSAENQIGGATPGLGNLFLGNSTRRSFALQINSALGRPTFVLSPPGIIISGAGASGNFVQGNIFGLDPSGKTPTDDRPMVSQGTPEDYFYPRAGVWIDNAGANIIGGERTGEGNLIASSFYGVVVTGANATGNQILGNLLGADGLGNYIPGAFVTSHIGDGYHTIGSLDVYGVMIADASFNFVGSATGGSNSIHAEFGVTVDGTNAFGNVIQNNLVSFGSASSGISLDGGGQNQVVSNEVIASSVGIAVGSPGNTIVRNNVESGAGNFLGEGIHVYLGNQNRLQANLINGWLGVGISLSSETTGQRLTNDDFDIDSGANNQLNCPELNHVISHNSHVAGNGVYRNGFSSQTYRLEFFYSGSGETGASQGQHFLGFTNMTFSAGASQFTFDLPTPQNTLGFFLTATVTDPGGNTSELSVPQLIGGDVHSDFDNVSDPIENGVPSRNGVSSNVVIHPELAGFGDGNGDGIDDDLQANVVSFPCAYGPYLTLSTRTAGVFLDVSPQVAPARATSPAGYVFPVGFVQFQVTNLSAGTVLITNYLPAGVSAGSVWNFGPTSDNPTPHWYQFTFDGTTGAQIFSDRLILHYVDGQRGDDDLSVNNSISTFFGPASAIIPGPALSIQLVGRTNVVDGFAGVTNQLLLNTFRLSWPGTATGYEPVYYDDVVLGNYFSGEELGATAVLSGGSYVITNTTASPSRFYRLQASP